MHISLCESCGYVHCGMEQCIHQALGTCLLDEQVIGLDSDDALYCWDYEESIELPSVSLQESRACDIHNGRLPTEREYPYGHDGDW